MKEENITSSLSGIRLRWLLRNCCSCEGRNGGSPSDELSYLGRPATLLLPPGACGVAIFDACCALPLGESLRPLVDVPPLCENTGIRDSADVKGAEAEAIVRSFTMSSVSRA